MALKSSREGLRKELVDYLGNLIINESLKKQITSSIDSFLKVDLLWENSSPNTSFVAQNIVINDYNKYKYLMIIFAPYCSEYGNQSLNGGLFTLNIFNDNKWYCFERYSDTIRFRFVKWYNNAITFTRGSSYSGGYNDSFAVPIKIYGVR